MRFRLVGILLALATLPAAAEVESPEAVSPCLGVSTTANTTLTTVPVVTGLVAPLFVTAPPGDTQRIFVLERRGRIVIHPRGTAPGTLTTFLDIESRVNDDGSEGGLLGLAFDPGYAATQHFWVNYTEYVPVQGQYYNVVARYTTSATNPNVADPASEMRVLRTPHPDTNHNGGMLAFGADGYLYVFRGDGGGQGDLHGVCGNGQSRASLLGKVLRIDVRGIDVDAEPPDCGGSTAVYGVPPSNPLFDGPGGDCDEIWAYGLRNPWRSTFDKLTGDLYIGDVGESCWEEINYAPASDPGGRNYGWRKMEGSHCFNAFDFSSCDPPGEICAGTPLCNDASITRPIVDFSHGVGCSVTGGYVYRGCRMSNWQGTYLYGDFCAGFVKGFKVVGGVATQHVDLSGQLDPGGSLGASLSSFGQDAQGELYIANIWSGTVLKIVPPFTDLEVSAPGAGNRFLLSRSASWTWENLTASTDVPVSFYRVYRGTPGGSYSCVFKALTPAWPSGGDPASPVPGQLFAYVVSAVNAAGQESLRGTPGTFNPATCP